jgi:hypothetical protein
MQDSLIGSLHPGQGMIPVSARLKSTSDCVVVGMMLPFTAADSTLMPSQLKLVTLTEQRYEPYYANVWDAACANCGQTCANELLQLTYAKLAKRWAQHARERQLCANGSHS